MGGAGADVEVRTDGLVTTLGIGALADRGSIESSIAAWVPQDYRRPSQPGTILRRRLCRQMSRLIPD